MLQGTSCSPDLLLCYMVFCFVSLLALLQTAGCQNEEPARSPYVDQEWAARQIEEIAERQGKAYRAQEARFDFLEAKAIVADIRAGRLDVAPRGDVPLPAESASLTCDGRVYVSVGIHAPSAYLFPMWVGKGSNLRAYLYVPDPKDGTAHKRLAEGATVRMVLPVTGGEPKPGDVEVVDQISPKWYRVSRVVD